MTIAQRHWGWITALILIWVAGFYALFETRGENAAAHLALVKRQDKVAQLRAEYQMALDDAAAEEKLRAMLGAETWRNLRAPPPRAQLVAQLRQFGLEAGLRDLDLTLGSAVPIAEDMGQSEGRPLLASPIVMKVKAISDRQVFAFLRRATVQLPGVVRLEKLVMKRHNSQDLTGASVVIEAEISMRWLTFGHALETARARP